MERLTTQTHAEAPPPCRFARALLLVGGVLGSSECFYIAGTCHFPIGAGWSIAISAESAGRFRLAACQHGRERTTLWALDGKDEHLAGVVLELSARILQSNGFLERFLT